MHNFSWRVTELSGDVSILINQCFAVASLELLVFLMCLPNFYTACVRLLSTTRHSVMKLYRTAGNCSSAVGGSLHLETERSNEGQLTDIVYIHIYTYIYTYILYTHTHTYAHFYTCGPEILGG